MIAGAPSRRPAVVAGVVTLRRATALDATRILAWNNAADVRAQSCDPRPITAKDHARWFAARLADPRGGPWIAVLDDFSVGVVRIDHPPVGTAGSGRISIVLDPSVRGRGLGRRVISLACAADGGPVVAEILVDNRASRACFEAAGFVRELTPAPPAPGARPAPLTTAGDRPVIRYLWRPDRAHAR